jgi:tryptophan 2,3-dioxygenase
MPLTYPKYLQLDRLLELQRWSGEEKDHDEVLFIIIHQVYELWFKLLLHELDMLGRCLESERPARALAGLKRILTVLKTMVAQMDVLETMSPVAFHSFRDRLDPASGFQSTQFREIEFMLGLRGVERLKLLPPDSPEQRAAQELLARPSLYDSFLRFLAGRGYQVPAAVLERDLSEPVGEYSEVQAVLLDVYRNDPLGAELAERLVDLDEGMQEWRYRHVKLAERMIGAKPGTGGSSGAEYLRTTLFKPLFRDLWAIRSAL